MQVFSDGIWNIAEAMSGIRMVGLPELAGTNYLLAALGVVSITTSVVAQVDKEGNSTIKLYLPARTAVVLKELKRPKEAEKQK